MISLEKKPLPEFCIAHDSKGNPKKMSDISGALIHYFSAIYADPDNKWDMQTCYDLFVDLNKDPADRGDLLLAKDSPEPRYRISCHYMIGRDGTLWELVPPPIRAWHAGRSEFNGRRFCNMFMLGFELVGHKSADFEPEQYESTAELTREFMDVYNFGEDWITGHEYVATPKGRKEDPGPTFDWDWFRNELRKTTRRTFVPPPKCKLV